MHTSGCLGIPTHARTSRDMVLAKLHQTNITGKVGAQAPNHEPDATTTVLHQQHRSSTSRSLPAGISHSASGGFTRCACTRFTMPCQFCRATCAADRVEPRRTKSSGTPPTGGMSCISALIMRSTVELKVYFSPSTVPASTSPATTPPARRGCSPSATSGHSGSRDRPAVGSRRQSRSRCPTAPLSRRAAVRPPVDRRMPPSADLLHAG